jgi:AraC-like DNA-binding protein
MDVNHPAGAAWISGRLVQLPSRTLLDTVSVSETESVVSALLAEHRIQIEGPRHEFHARVSDCFLGDLRLAHFTYGTAFTVQSQPLDSYVLNLTLRGHTRVRHGAASVSTRPGEGTVFSPFGPTSLTWSHDAEVLSLIVARSALEDHFRKITGAADGKIVFSPLIGAGSAYLLRSVIGSALGASADGEHGLPEALAWQLRDTVLSAMLLELTHSRQGMLTEPRGAEASSVCDAAVSQMRRQLSAPPSIPALAARLGVSERSLQLSFREHLGTTPTAKFKQLRLEAVHEALLRSNPRRHTVARVAADAGGFFHLGRFASEYFAMFGERPSDTLRRQDPGTVGLRTSGRRASLLR